MCPRVTGRVTVHSIEYIETVADRSESGDESPHSKSSLALGLVQHALTPGPSPASGRGEWLLDDV